MILHVDMDAFYAAVEVREQPELAGKPVIVGADPRGRGVVSTASYEARRFGIRSAMPISEAYRRCPHGIFLPVRMSLYAAVSHQVMEIFGRFTPLVEPLSIDEAFLDVSGCESLFGPPAAIARRIKDAVQTETRLTCSVGVAPNKFLAKLATELGKPDGLTVIDAADVRRVLDPLPVERVFGVGPKTAAALAELGLTTVGAIARAPRALLESALGKAGAEHVGRLARGEDDRRVEPHRRPCQVGSERTFDVDIDSPVAMRRHLLDLAQDVGRHLRQDGLTARGVRLKLRTDDFATTTRQRVLPAPTDAARVLYRCVVALLSRQPPRRPVRLLGVTAFELVFPDTGVQGQLFAPPGDADRASAVEHAADAVRERFGPDALRPAALIEPPAPRPARREPAPPRTRGGPRSGRP